MKLPSPSISFLLSELVDEGEQHLQSIAVNRGRYVRPAVPIVRQTVLPNGRDIEFKPSRSKRMWDETETEMLREGIARFGHNWKRISLEYPSLDRTPVQLKDRARNVRNILTARGEDLGVWDPRRLK